MRFPHLSIPCLLWAMILLPACEPPPGNHSGKDINGLPDTALSEKAKGYMQDEDFETLVKRFENQERDTWQQPDKVLALMGDLRGKTVADIGAGTGYFTFRLAQRAHKTIAIDIDERFLQYIAGKNKRLFADSLQIETRLSQANSPGLAAAEADAVIVVNTYHHIDARTEYFRLVHRGLKPGGKLYVIDFKKGDFPMGPPDRLKLELKQIEKELQTAGFGSVHNAPLELPYQFVLVAEKSR
ncbi:MAG: class I SAM-dependent methyltransferase [Bacteroidetes bacterium]|nr:class I SAM-dependent methyltransferase [Bacteroidota bacterium]